MAAIVVKDGEVVGEAFRGELDAGDHAEYTLLERKLPDAALAGATLYTTLEPCTSRNRPKIPCVERIIERRIKRVVIGMIDPNDAIRGRGELRLRSAGVEVTRFDPEYMAELEEMNREFIRDQTGPGQVERDHAQTVDPVSNEVGPNGHRIGYTDAGDKVEWIPDPDVENGEVAMLLRRNDADLLTAYNEMWNRVWWNRHQTLKARVDSGEEQLSDARAQAFAEGEAAAARLEDQYGRDDLECDEFKLGMLNGRLSALAWVLGAEWDESLDT